MPLRRTSGPGAAGRSARWATRACFSFYPGKNLGAVGDAGLVLSSDASLIAEVRRLRDHGRTGKYLHDVIGWCSRLDGLQAAVLLAKLQHLATWTAARQARAEEYRVRLGDLVVPWDAGAVHHLLVARFPARDGVQAGLRDLGTGTGVHYPLSLAQQPATASFGGPTPHADDAAATVLSLPWTRS